MRRGSAFVTRKSQTRSMGDILPGYFFGEAVCFALFQPCFSAILTPF